ncbi:MAG: alkaline phosphatase family protein [Acidimicrobiales bacterium]
MTGGRWTRREVLRASALAGPGLLLARAGWRPDRAEAAPPLAPGSRPFPGLPEGTDMLPQIEHIVVLMMENHSFDNYFGTVGRGDGLTIGVNGKPSNTNPLDDGRLVRSFPMPSPCQVGVKVSQSWNATHRQYDGGAMDGFARTSGPAAMGYWDEATIPFYRGLASVFPIADRYFASAPCQTYPNRRFLQAGTAAGLISTDTNSITDPTPANGLIWDRLDAHGITWNNYFVDLPELGLFLDFYLSHVTKSLPVAAFLAQAATGLLPSVSLVSPDFEEVSEENPQDIQLGEAYSASIINAVLAGPKWAKTLLVFTYDEHGGYYDHVAPPPAVAPDTIGPRINVAAGDEPGGYDLYGMRVPTVVVSPYARPDYVSHVVHDHTSILKLIETKWNLGALTYRDANASNLLDMLDFAAAPAFLEPPSLPLPGIASAPSLCRVTGEATVVPADAFLPAPGSTSAVEPQPARGDAEADAPAKGTLAATGAVAPLGLAAAAAATAVVLRRAVRAAEEAPAP